MPNRAFLNDFRAAVSNERLDKYRQRGVGGGDENLLLHYAWNIALEESFYPLLQCLEVALRNAVHDAASTAYQTQFWFDTPGLLDVKSVAGIAEARQKLTAENKPDTAAGIVAEQQFGFWTACFNGSQEQVLWPRIYRQAFPLLPRRLRKRGTIAQRLNEIRKFRNRIFHHEPVWYLNDLRVKHLRMLELIKWISPAMAEFAEAVDRFPDLYAAGMPAYKTQLEQKFRRIAPNQAPPV